MDGPQKADSGHPGTAMALAPIGYTLYGRVMHHNPANPKWVNRDRFILSCGHACILQYSLLHLTGYDLSLDDLRAFRQWESKTPGHPEHFMTPGVETTTGPLGQGLSNAVGFAVAERLLGAHFNRPNYNVVDHFTYVICSDGDLMEGVTSEAASLAGHLKTGKIIALYDDNHITIEGTTALAFTEDVDARYRAYDWHVQRITDPNDLNALEAAIKAAQADPRPSLISVRTHIAYPAPDAVDTSKAHGSPLGDKEVALTKEILGLPPHETFYVPAELAELKKQILERGAQEEQAWNDMFASYRKDFPELAKEWDLWHSAELPAGWDKDIPVFEPSEKGLATRASGSKVLNAIAPRIPNLVGGAADLAPSTLTLMKDLGSQSSEEPGGRNFHFGIREHAMGSFTNGLILHGGLRAFCSTFFIFSDYMRPAVRLAALMRLPAIYVWTHDSIGLGEDGPTHQAVEQAASLRAIPNFTLIRPGDANEVAEAWKIAISHSGGPVGLVLTRQEIPTFDRTKMAPAAGVQKGAYVLSEAKGGQPKVILIGTGSELQHCVAAQAKLEAAGVPARVVSMPSWELFHSQSPQYREEVLPAAVTARVAVEAGTSFGWERWIGTKGATVCIDHYGASAPWQTNMQKFGFTADHVVEVANSLLA